MIIVVSSSATQLSAGGIVDGTNTVVGSAGIVTDVCLFTGENETLLPHEDEINIYPNPFSTSATITINAELRIKNVEFRMYDLLGRHVRNFSITQSPNQPVTQLTIDRGSLQSGMYFYSLSLGEGRGEVYGKLIIQ